MSDTAESRTIDVLPDYPQIERGDGLLIHTRKQAEAGKIKAPGKRLPVGKCNEKDVPR